MAPFHLDADGDLQMHTLDGAGGVRLATARSDASRAKLDGHDRIADNALRAVLASHRPGHTGTSCTACEFVYTKARPLCPPVAGVLRELSTGDSLGRGLTPLASYSTARLRATAREHSGEGRCRRCGFVYAGEVRSCPTNRRIFAELEARAKAPVTQTTGQGLCVGKGSGWVVTGHDPRPWTRAMAACSMCPLLAQCKDRLASGEQFREQIIAGRLFTASGAEVLTEEIEDYAMARGRRNRKKKGPVSAAPPWP
nr:hypothetical protein [Prescottella equi]